MSALVDTVDALPADAIPPACAADLRVVAAAIAAQGELNYQCAQGIIRYVQRDPNNNGPILNLVGNADCIPPSQCVDEDYWVITGYNNVNQANAAEPFEDDPEAAADVFLNWVYWKNNLNAAMTGFLDVRWRFASYEGGNCYPSGCTDNVLSGHARQVWMEDTIADVFVEFGW